MSPPIEKFCPEAKAVAVSALPVKAPVKLEDVTEVKPANVVELPPKLIDVVPTLKLELANLAFVTLASRILVVVTASVSIEALRATAPVPSNEIDEAVISPLIEKFCP